MTVQCLNDYEKQAIVRFYNSKQPVKQIAEIFGTSERTIGRVITEAGLATPVQRLTEEASMALKILKKHNVEVKDLDKILSNREYYTPPKLTNRIPALLRPSANASPYYPTAA